ncbi:MAG TPA: cupin domain-containing protein [Balneolaceae bacterium]|nr:cupin domain-containing protein [Balneolaceae bacterium]
MSRENLTSSEKKQLDELLSSAINPKVIHYGSNRTDVARYDKRVNMYGGDGTVYLLQMFEENELVNNRIGAYMILPEKGTSAGFHTHGTRGEQEIYVVIAGKGEYLEKDYRESDQRSYQIQPGHLTTIKGDALHSVTNTSDEPLIIFVITTNEP